MTRATMVLPVRFPAADADPTVHVTVARSFDEVEALRERWSALRPDAVAADLDHYQTLVRAEPRMLRPHAVALDVAGRPTAVALGRVEDVVHGARLGYWRFYAPKVRSLTIGPEGVLGDPDVATCELLLAALRSSLADGEADILVMTHLPVSSAMFRVATTTPPFLQRQHVVRRQPHYFLSLPDSFDEFLRSRSKSTRYHLMRYRKRLLKELGDRVSMRVYTEMSELDDVFRDVNSIARTTYQTGIGVGFEDTEAHRALTSLAMANGWFSGYLLCVDGVPRAFLTGTLYRGRFLVGHMGYDPVFREHRLGTELLLRVVEDLCADPKATTLDFGNGDAEYKARLSDSVRDEADAVVYAPTFRAARVNVARSGLVRVAGLVDRVGRATGAHDRVKRLARRRASAR